MIPDPNRIRSAEYIRPEFSWSIARWRKFNFCPRAYFLRYYGAWGGWEEHCSEELKFAYRLKNLRRLNSWIDEIFISVLKKVLINPDHISHPEKLETSLRREISYFFARDRNRILNKNWLEDPKSANIFEIYYAPEKAEEILSEAREILFLAADIFIRENLADELLAIRYLDWLELKTPLEYQIVGIKLWTNPHLVWKSKGVFNVLNFNLRKCPQAPEDLGTSLQRIWAEGKSGLSGDKVNIRYFHPNAIEKEICPENNTMKPEEISEFILYSAEKMMEQHNSGCLRDENTFPPNPNCKKEHPFDCEFRELCH